MNFFFPRSSPSSPTSHRSLANHLFSNFDFKKKKRKKKWNKIKWKISIVYPRKSYYKYFYFPPPEKTKNNRIKSFVFRFWDTWVIFLFFISLFWRAFIFQLRRRMRRWRRINENKFIKINNNNNVLVILLHTLSHSRLQQQITHSLCEVESVV